MGGSIVKLKLAEETPGFGWFKYFIKRRRIVGVQVVHDDFNEFGLWIMDVDQLLHTLSPVDLGTPLSDFHMPPPT